MECLGFWYPSGIANLQRVRFKRRIVMEIVSKIFAVNQTGLLASKYFRPPARDSQDAALSNHSHSYLLLCHLERWGWALIILITHADARDQIVWVWPRYITLFIHCSVSHNLTRSLITNKLENINTIKRS